jgi:bifunctional non-homologous end joining protein LigD
MRACHDRFVGRIGVHLIVKRRYGVARQPDGIFVAPFERARSVPTCFVRLAKWGLEGLVSKRRDRPYRAGRSPDWIKVKNRSHPAMERVKDAFA